MNEAILMSASADNIDFMIHGLFSFQLFGQEVWITTSHVCIAIVMLVLVIFSIVANRKIAHATEVPDTFQNVLELMVEKLSGIVENNMGSHAPKFTNYICTIFVFILFSNISGLFGLRPPTADYGTTFALGIITFALIHITKWRHQSFKRIWVDMCSPLPPWFPLWAADQLDQRDRSADFLITAFVCECIVRNRNDGPGLRSVGEDCICLPAVLHVYFDLFSGAIQTYVFCMLTMTYITQSYGDEE